MKDSFKELLEEKDDSGLSDNFDNEMMQLIRKHALNKKKDKKYLTLMYLFFGIGVMFGIIITATFTSLNITIGTRSFSVDHILITMLLIGTMLFLFEKLYKATLVKAGKEMF